MLYFLYPFLWKERICLNYCIKNNRNVYIKLGENGTPTACAKSMRGEFEYSKAKNILNNLPKALKNMHFRLQAIEESIVVVKPDNKLVKQKLENKDNYVLSEDITRWVDKFGFCSDVIEEARKRSDVLIAELHIADKELLDILHIIEIERPKDMYRGWSLYKKIRENRTKRRVIKDELLIINNVLEEVNPSCLQRKRIQSAIDGLFTREYKFRIVDYKEGDEDAEM